MAGFGYKIRSVQQSRNSEVKWADHGELDPPRKAQRLAVWILHPAVSEKKPPLFSVRWERRDFFMQKNNNLMIWKSESLSHTKVLCGMALFMALDVLLGSMTVNITETLRISFTFLSVAASCYFFGLWPNVLAAFLVDLIGYLAHPVGAYMPLFALTAILNAVIYSLFFYGQNKVSVPRVLMAKGLSTILCNIIINPILLSMMYGTPIWVLMSERLVKNLFLFPIEAAMLYLVLRECSRLKKRISWLS